MGQVAIMAFGVTDTVVAGRFAQEALAALSVGSAIYISVYVTLMGLLQALLPILSEMHGANKQAAIGRALRQGLYLCAWWTSSRLPTGRCHPKQSVRITGVSS